MRKAKAADHWRHLSESVNRPFKLDKFEYHDVLGLGTGALILDRALTVLCGRNGVGKSTLLRSVAHLFRAAEASPDLIRRMERARLVCYGQWNRSAYTLDTAEDKPVDWLDQLHVRLVEPSLTNGIQRYFRSLDADGLVALVEATERVPLQPDELESANFVLGRQYTEISFAEIEVELGALEVVPYFSVSVDGAKYGSEDMGMGEFSVLFLLWALRTLPKSGAFLLVEEPEAFVSPAAQRKLMDVLAKYCDERRAWVLVTTHSPAILANVPSDQIRAVLRGTEGTLVERTSIASYLETLDMLPRKNGVVLVEDLAAREFLYRVCDKFFEEFRTSYEVVTCPDGASQIIAVLNKVPKASTVCLCGVLDGDLGENVKDVRGAWGVAILPGPCAPDIHIRNAVEADVGGAAALLGVDDRTLGVKLSNIKGCDFHDWAALLAQLLGRSETDVLSAGSRLWVEDAAHDAATSAFCDELRAQLVNRASQLG